MKLSTREDVDAPIGQVYEAVTDFDSFERQMLRRGIEVMRDESCDPTTPGARWELRFTWRDRPIDVEARLVSVDPGNGYAIESTGNGVICLAVVDLVALSRSRTRMFVSLDLKPTSLASRIFLQTLRLAKGSLSDRLKRRVSEFAAGIA